MAHLHLTQKNTDIAHIDKMFTEHHSILPYRAHFVLCIGRKLQSLLSTWKTVYRYHTVVTLLLYCCHTVVTPVEKVSRIISGCSEIFCNDHH
jgi:hypothetical protein